MSRQAEALAPEAETCGVRLVLGPIHPTCAADRGVLSALGQALDVAERFPAEQVGVVDTFHVWWDADPDDVVATLARRYVEHVLDATGS